MVVVVVVGGRRRGPSFSSLLPWVRLFVPFGPLGGGWVWVRVRVSGIGYRVSGIGYRVSGIGYRVSGIGYRVSGGGADGV